MVRKAGDVEAGKRGSSRDSRDCAEVDFDRVAGAAEEVEVSSGCAVVAEQSNNRGCGYG
jgi:hypothetical protein